jgi:DNA repair exonuclease SbcCD ATPase subunit
MQEEENKKDVPMVDIDTSGPGADVELEEQKPEVEVETKEDSSPAPQVEETREEKAEGSDAQPEAKQEEKPEEKKEEKPELETYSKDVQRRISKLTKKWREAQRQADEALAFAKNQKEQKEKLQKKYSQVEQVGVKDREERIKSGLQASAAKLAAAKEAGDLAAEVEANKEIARLGYEEARLNELKAAYEETKSEVKTDEIPKAPQPRQATPRS